MKFNKDVLLGYLIGAYILAPVLIGFLIFISSGDMIILAISLLRGVLHLSLGLIIGVLTGRQTP